MKSKMPTNEELLGRYSEGDFLAFDLFYKQNHHLIFTFLKSRLWNPSDAEEAFQETFIRIHKSVQSYDPTQKALPWILTIARNVAIDYLRKQRRQPLGGSGMEISGAPNAEAGLAAREELTQMLAELSPDELAVIKGRFIDDVSFKSLADRCGTTEANTRQKFSRLLKRLKAGGGA